MNTTAASPRSWRTSTRGLECSTLAKFLVIFVVWRHGRGARSPREAGKESAPTTWRVSARRGIDATGEVKYFISNAPADMFVETLLRVAFRRWHVEHSFRVVKNELGFGHFEG